MGRYLLQHTNILVAWLFAVTFSTVLVLGASSAVVLFAPEAAGAGVDKVMAFLNGCHLPRVRTLSSSAQVLSMLLRPHPGALSGLSSCLYQSALQRCDAPVLPRRHPAGLQLFNVRTLGVKFASCCLAVASGVPVGPEGPMVHIGAALGAALSQGHSTTLGFSTGLFHRFRNPKDKRDFVTAGECHPLLRHVAHCCEQQWAQTMLWSQIRLRAGTAAGIATAFGAPIGGLLFALEEVASTFSQALGWQVRVHSVCLLLRSQLPKCVCVGCAGLLCLHGGSAVL